MFEGFDFSLLDDPTFKEDSVREELVVPILKRLGYAASGPNRIVRSKNLVHPFVMIGSRSQRISIIPDYVLMIDDKPAFVLDAKAPDEPVVHSRHVEQAFSYSIHPEIRAHFFGLCNGRELVVYSVDASEPLLNVHLRDMSKRWKEVEDRISPRAFREPWLSDFLPDFGLLAMRLGFPRGLEVIFPHNTIADVSKIRDDLYTITSGVEWEDGRQYAISLDFDATLFEKLLAIAPADAAAQMRALMGSQPFQGVLSQPFEVTIVTELGSPTQGQFEVFVPFMVTAVDPLPEKPTASAAPGP